MPAVARENRHSWNTSKCAHRLPWATNARRRWRLTPIAAADRACTMCAAISPDAETRCFGACRTCAAAPAWVRCAREPWRCRFTDGLQGLSQQALQGEAVIATQLQLRAIEQHDGEFAFRQRQQFPHAIEVDERGAMDAHETRKRQARFRGCDSF